MPVSYTETLLWKLDFDELNKCHKYCRAKFTLLHKNRSGGDDLLFFIVTFLLPYFETKNYHELAASYLISVGTD